jgi:hypothetical protein
VSTAAPPESPGSQRAVAFERYAVDSARTGPVRELPIQATDRSAGVRERENAVFPEAPAAGPADEPVQASSTTASTTASLLNFDGLGFADNAFSVRYAPPDTNGAVGREQYVQAVNTEFAVYGKTGGKLKQFFGSQLFSGFSGVGSSCADHDDGDPVVQYDKAAGRWLVTQFQVTVTPYLECIAIFDGEDATGGYHVYAYAYGTDFVDYPKIGVWPDSYNVTYNVFANGRSFTGGEVCALNRIALLDNPTSAPAQKCFRTSTSYPSLLPSDLDGSTPPPGTNGDAYLVNMAGGKLNSWRLHLDWAGSGSTFTGPTVVSGTAAFSAACSGGGTCIPQRGTSQKLDSLADRLMNRLAYRVVSGVPTLVVTHAINVATSGGAGKKATTPGTGVRWYQLVPNSGNAAALQVAKQGTYAPDSTHRWLSTAAMDENGAMAVGYSASSSSVYPSIRVASRLADDADGTLGSEQILQAGGGSQSGQRLSRWGDYASMSVDPMDDCTLWFTTEYLTATGAFNWSTRIISLKASSCS